MAKHVMKKSKWIVFSVALLLVSGVQEAQQKGQVLNQQARQSPKIHEFNWQQSLLLPWGDPRIYPIGGTEIRALAAFEGKLFAANGYWMDTERENPTLPGAQVLRLDGPGSAWQVDLELTDRTPRGLRLYQAISTLQRVRFTTDGAGRPLSEPIDLLLAGVWKRGPGLDVFAHAVGHGWSKIPIVGQENAPRGTQVRAFSLHKDRITGVDLVFAGATNASIFTGTYGSTRRNITWNPQAELRGDFNRNLSGAKGRVSSFAECNGKLYAGAYDTIYERVDGPSPVWRQVFITTIHAQNSNSVTGLRGLTCIRAPSGSNVLLASVEDNPARIYRIDPNQLHSGGGNNATQELDVSSYLSEALGTKATYAIVAYNDMTPYPGSSEFCPNLLMGFEVNTPQAPQTFFRHDVAAHYLVRDCNGGYAVREIRDFQTAPKPRLVSVRTLAMSPFLSDPPGTIYAGGFDANAEPVHNTAWLYKGIPVPASQ